MTGSVKQADPHQVLVAGREIQIKRGQGHWHGSLWHKQASKRHAHLGPRKGAGGLAQGQLGGVAAGDGAKQALQALGAAKALQVANQGKGAVAVALPAVCVRESI